MIAPVEGGGKPLLMPPLRTKKAAGKALGWHMVNSGEVRRHCQAAAFWAARITRSLNES
jgi:hypothetical protein